MPDSSPIAAPVRPGEPVDGPLAGVRTTVKELVAVGGVGLTANTAVELPAHVTAVAHEAPVIGMLRAAGARIESTSTTHELAWGITTWSEGRRVANPVLDGRVAGGSSGGAAALVAAGEAELGVGTDTAGSIRIPAAWCGIVGWKPSFDLIPTDGVLPLAPGLDTVGFLARDVGLLDRVADVVGAGSLDGAPDRPLRVAELRVPGAVADRRLAAELRAALRALAAQGHEVLDPVEGPAAGETVATFGTLQLVASRRVHREVLGTWPAQRDRYGDAIRRRLTAADVLDVAEVAEAEDRRASLRRTVAGWFAHVDALLLPTTGCVPPHQHRPDEVDVDGARHDLRATVLPHTTIANLVGAPAVSVPARIGGEPTGLQVLTPQGTDRRGLRVAAELVR